MKVLPIAREDIDVCVPIGIGEFDYQRKEIKGVSGQWSGVKYYA